MISSILVVVDDWTHDTLALEAAASLHQRFAAQIILLGVSDEVDAVRRSLGKHIDVQTVDDFFITRRKDQLLENARALGFEPSTVTIRSGRAFIEAIKAAMEFKVDLIVQASHPATTPHPFFTSADAHLIRKSPVPVLLVKDHKAFAPARILAAVDVLADDSETFNKEILRMAGAFAAANASQLTVLTAWSVSGESVVRNNPWFNQTDRAVLDKAVEETKIQAQNRFAALEDWFGMEFKEISVQWHCVKGIARDVIPSTVNQSGADLVVVGSVGRTGIPGLLIGNTAETVLGQINVPVLTLKPALFKSPVLAGA